MGLTDTVFGTPGTTTVQQAPGTRPPGYQFARDFYGSLGNIASNPFPTYQGQLDPGLSPTLQNLLRQAQGYAQSGPPEILAGVQGSLGQFMNPSFANPMARLQLGAPDYFNQNPNQTVYNGGTVSGLAGAFGQTGSNMSGVTVQPGQANSNTFSALPRRLDYSMQGSPGQGPMPSMSGQPGQMNVGTQGGQTQGSGTPPPYMQAGTQGLQNAFLRQAKPLQGLPSTGQFQFPGQPGEIIQWSENGSGPGYNPNELFHGVDPGTSWMPNGQFPPAPGAPGSMHGGAPGGQTYGGYSVEQLQQHPELAQHLGAHAAGLWRAFSGHPGSMGGVMPTGRHPLDRRPVPGVKPMRDPATGGIATQPGG